MLCKVRRAADSHRLPYLSAGHCCAGDDEVMQAKGVARSSAVVGKNVPVPRLANLPRKAPDAAPVQQAAFRTSPAKEEKQQAGPSTAPEAEEEPVLSWRGTRTGAWESALHCD